MSSVVLGQIDKERFLYQIELALSENWTKDIVRRPWDVSVVVQALPHLDKWSKEQFFDKNPHMTREQFLHAIKNNTFPSDNCYPHAKILRDSDPSKYALVLGSLGFRQSDGRVYWEYG